MLWFSEIVLLEKKSPTSIHCSLCPLDGLCIRNQQNRIKFQHIYLQFAIFGGSHFHWTVMVSKTTPQPFRLSYVDSTVKFMGRKDFPVTTTVPVPWVVQRVRMPVARILDCQLKNLGMKLSNGTAYIVEIMDPKIFMARCQ